MPAIVDLVHHTYAERGKAWESALATTTNWLERLCEDVLKGEQDKSRLRVDPGRIKERSRATAKLSVCLGVEGSDPDDDKGRDQDVSLEEHVRDIVGTKVVCKSTRDQQLIIDAIRAAAVRGDVVIAQEKDYLTAPKPSGYRAHHYTIRQQIPGADPVQVEIQIKTMLQDAWSELTHENNYKPGSPIATGPFHDAVAAVMAGMLAAVDDLADRLAFDLELKMQSPEDGSTADIDSRTAENDDEPASEPFEVKVVKTGPRYALAENKNGVTGLIRAADVRALTGRTDYISVDEFVVADDELEVTETANERGRYFHPLRLVDHD